MGFFSHNWNVLKAKLASIAPGELHFPQWGFLNYVTPPAKTENLLKSYKSWVYICSSKNAVAVASTPLRLFVAKPSGAKTIVDSKGVPREISTYLAKNAGLLQYFKKDVEIEEILEHPYLDLMKNINPFMNRQVLWEITELDLELAGNAYWWVLKNNLGVPEQIWRLQPDHVKIIPDKELFIKGYVYIKGVQQIPFEEEEIIHFKFPNPNDPFYGYSPLEAIWDTFHIAKKMDEYERGIFANMGRPDGVLEVSEGILTDDEYTRLKKNWKETYGGSGNAGKVAILEKGLSYKPITIKPREMNFLQSRKNVMLEIADAYGVPMSKLTTENVNLANAQIGEHQYQRDTILPRLRRIEEKINEKLMPMYDSRLFVAFDNPVPDDVEIALRIRESNLKSYLTSVNEERQKEGMEAVEWGDRPLAPMGIAPLGLDVGLDEEETPAPSPEEDEDLVPEEVEEELFVMNMADKIRNQIKNGNGKYTVT